MSAGRNNHAQFMAGFGHRIGVDVPQVESGPSEQR